MSYPFIGEIRVVGFRFAPLGWLPCDGETYPVNQYPELFAVIGNTFGGDGKTNFTLPNFEVRSAIGQGKGAGLTPYAIGAKVGAQTVTLNEKQMPIHSHHPFHCDEEPAQDTNPAGDLYAGAAKVTYAARTENAAFAPQTVQTVGGGQPHDNMAPYQVLLYVIAAEGIPPKQG